MREEVNESMKRERMIAGKAKGQKCGKGSEGGAFCRRSKRTLDFAVNRKCTSRNGISAPLPSLLDFKRSLYSKSRFNPAFCCYSQLSLH